MAILLNHVSYVYQAGTEMSVTALNDINLKIPDGQFIGLIGHTGSGKSTLVQHLNGILHPSSGQVLVDGVDLAGKGKEVLAARRKVGMVFQYPEHQLFEETVALDVAFGPKNMELPAAEIEKRVRQAMEFVNLDYDTYKDRSPFQLSGGQMRRAAIAGVVALQPKYLVLDEPTAGLDPRGREDLLQRIVQLHKKEKITIVFVSHNMDDIARVADRVVFMDQGMVLLDEAPAKAFFAEKEIAQAGLAAPQMVTLLMKLQAKGLAVDPAAFTMEDGVAHIMKALKGAEPC